jgi:hypothetical protein
VARASERFVGSSARIQSRNFVGGNQLELALADRQLALESSIEIVELAQDLVLTLFKISKESTSVHHGVRFVLASVDRDEPRSTIGH